MQKDNTNHENSVLGKALQNVANYSVRPTLSEGFKTQYFKNNSMRCNMKRICGLASCSKYHNRLFHEENDECRFNGSANSVSDDNNRVYIKGSKAHCNIMLCYVMAFVAESSKLSLIEGSIADHVSSRSSVDELWLR
ncbi:hypothetical protein GQX74_011127 [Glossina fuscipes]|nr:hypothetical protein GQX74_011127 [Glossina fuscipes]